MLRSLLLWVVKVGIVAAVLWYFLRDPLPSPADLIVAVCAAVLLGLSYAAMMASIRRARDLRLLQQTGEPPVDGKRMALVGTLKATGDTLHAPLSGKECLGYFYEIFHTVRTGGRRGTSRSRKVTDFLGIALAPCVIHTLHGDVALLSYPYLEDFREDTFSHDDAGMRRAAEYIRTTTFATAPTFLDQRAAMSRLMLDTDGSQKKDWRMTAADDLRKMRATEERIPAGVNVCAFGTYSQATRSLAPASAFNSRSLLLVKGEPEEIGRGLSSSTRMLRKIAVTVPLPAVVVVAFILFAPWTWIRAVPGGSFIVEKQTGRLAIALANDDLREIAAAIRYLDPNLYIRENARTPLMEVRSAQAADLLMRRGARLAAHDAHGYSVLMHAAANGSPELLRYLASHGADVNERLETDPATSVLSRARDFNTPEAVDALVKAGARER